MNWFSRLISLMLAFSFALMQLPVNAVAAAAEERGFDVKTSAAIEQLVQGQMASGRVPGMSVGIWVPDRGRFVHAYGTADVATGAPFLLSDHARIASITKTFTATEVLRLVDRHLVSLDGDHLSKWVGGVPYGDQITVRQLLNMTAGVFDYTSDPTFVARFDANPVLPFTPQEVLAIIENPGNKPAFAPGTAGMWQYSDSNYVLLGLIIENVTHQPVGRAIEQDVVDPADLEHTSFPISPAIPRPFAHGYLNTPSGLRDVTAVNPAVAGAAGAMISTLRDLKVWARVLATGTLLTRETQRQRLQFVDAHLSPTLKTGYGLGLFDIQGFLGHNGAIYGFNTAMFYLPATGATLVVIANESDNFHGVALGTAIALAKLLYPELFPTAPASQTN
jgi:D-alanyl-D-alanine carboxypeptidase